MISASHSLLSFRYLRMKLPRYNAKRTNFEPEVNNNEDFENYENNNNDSYEEQPADFGGFDNSQLRPDLLNLTQFPEGLSQIPAYTTGQPTSIYDKIK
mmetsp:Transcript_28556/g.25271  ORF Transcript_28556/g.25271 Transcript_28556/m.25271 type:complete len:98 (-) Transcript_28556:304-597(-)